MNYLNAIKKILLFTIIPLIGVATFIPAWEAISNAEMPYVESKGNCRVVNTSLALEKNFKYIYVLKQENNSLSHIVAVDENLTIHDNSRGENADMQNLNEYMKHYHLYIAYKAEIFKGEVTNTIFSDIKSFSLEKFLYAYYVNTFIFFRQIPVSITRIRVRYQTTNHSYS
ncbi:MAG: hypothetical protein ABXS91_01885 [Sulfurimonas sp.]